MKDVYREREVTMALRFADGIRRLADEAERAERSVDAAVHARRSARVVAGVTGATGGLAVLSLGGLGWAYRELWDAAVVLLVVMPAVIALAYGVQRGLAPSFLRRRVAGLWRPTGRADFDLMCLEATSPERFVAEDTRRLEVAGIAAPLAAAALLGPLTLHLLVGGPALVNDSLADLTQFGPWLGLSAALVSHAHLFVACAFYYCARSLARGEVVRPLRYGLATATIAAICAAIPGAMLIMLPPLLTFATGVFIALPACTWAVRASARERSALLAAHA
jgi:hypothetical protein